MRKTHLSAWQRAPEHPDKAKRRAQARELIHDLIDDLIEDPPSKHRDAEIRVWEEVKANLNLNRTLDKQRLRIQAQTNELARLNQVVSERNEEIAVLKDKLAAARRAIPRTPTPDAPSNQLRSRRSI